MKFYGMNEVGERKRANDENKTPVDSLVLTGAEYVQVVCLVLPTGENLWFQAAKGHEYMCQIIDKWKAEHPEFTDTPCNLGAVHITMPRDKYTAIAAHFTRAVSCDTTNRG